MRTRLLLVLAVLGAVVVGAFAVPLALATADARTRELALGRQADMQRFAGLADDYVRTGRLGLLRAEMETYNNLYGEPLAVVSTRGVDPIAVGTSLSDPVVSSAVSRALRNERASGVEPLAPWSADSIVFAQPVGTGAQVSGAVVIVASTQRAKADISLVWAVIGAGILAALAGFGALAVFVSGWILRPLEVLSLRIQRLAVGLPFRRLGTQPSGGPRRDDEWSGPPELRALARSFDAMASAVQESADAQKRLVADTAHQLRNPLAALQLRLDTMEAVTPQEGRAAVTGALDETARLGRILGDLLSLSTAEAPRDQDETTRAFCVPAVVAAERIRFWQRAAEESGLNLKGRAATSQTAAKVRASDLEQILDVLLDNECKYAGVGATVSVHVEESSDREGGHAVSILVEDDGPGVPADQLRLLTRRFYRGTWEGRAGDIPKPEGTGLGLAIAVALAEANGGRLRLARSSSGGLLTAVSFPAAEASEASGQAVMGEGT